MELVIHAADRNAEICIEGRGISIPPNEPFEVDAITGTDHMTSDYQYETNAAAVAAEMVSKLWHVGLVRIPVTTEKSRNGVTYNFDTAKALAEAKLRLIKAEEQMLSAYVTQCRELISENKPAQPPGPRISAIIAKYGIDLKAKYGIVPIGYDAVAAGAQKNEEMEELKRQNAEMKRQNAEMADKMNAFMAQFDKKGK